MTLVFFDLPVLVKGLAEAKVFHSINDLEDYLKSSDPSIQRIDVAGIGYHNKSVCNEEVREVWNIFKAKDPKLAGKVIQVEDIKKFKKSITKWISTMEEKFPDDCEKIRKLIETIN